MASSFDYRALTEEEKQRILNGNGPPPGGAGLAFGGAVGQKPAQIGLNLAAVKE